jgi:mRNA interferase RelE/StbE
MPTFRLKVPDDLAALVRNLHPEIKLRIRDALQAILDDPALGKALKDELHGLRSFRVKRYRIIYRLIADKKYLEIIAIGPRRHIYEETFKLIIREEKKK